MLSDKNSDLWWTVYLPFGGVKELGEKVLISPSIPPFLCGSQMTRESY